MTTEYWKNLDGRIGEVLKGEVDSLIKSRKYYPFSKDEKQGENTYNVYGDVENNRLYMTLENGGRVFYGRINSPVAFPVMEDRLFGMDQMDVLAANWLSDMLIFVYLEGMNKEEVLENWDADFDSRANAKADTRHD